MQKMVTKIEQMLVDAWEKFYSYYNTKAPQYRKSWPLKHKESTKDLTWICWNENDLTFHIGRFFYDILSSKKEKEFLNIELHFEKNISSANFKNYKFPNSLDKLKEKLQKWPKVDMIVAYEDSKDSFLLCAEAKYFHSKVRYDTTPIDLINADIKKLKALRDFEIAKRVVFILFDDYYWCHDEKTANEIWQRLNAIEREDGITVLFHTSEAKLREI
jgi:hypothetical protein